MYWRECVSLIKYVISFFGLEVKKGAMVKYFSLRLWPYAMTSFLYYGFIGCFISYLAMLLADRGFY